MDETKTEREWQSISAGGEYFRKVAAKICNILINPMLFLRAMIDPPVQSAHHIPHPLDLLFLLMQPLPPGTLNTILRHPSDAPGLCRHNAGVHPRQRSSIQTRTYMKVTYSRPV